MKEQREESKDDPHCLEEGGFRDFRRKASRIIVNFREEVDLAVKP